MLLRSPYILDIGQNMDYDVPTKRRAIAEDNFWKSIEELRAQLLQQERVTMFRQLCRDSDQQAETVQAGEEQATVSSSTASQKDSTPSSSGSSRKEDVLRQIQEVISNVVEGISRGESPSLSYTSRTNWDNVRYEEGVGLEMASEGAKKTVIQFDALGSVNKFALTVKTLSHMRQLIQTNSYSTKRDMYYQDPKAYGSQSTLDGIIDNISCMLRVPRWELNILATSKGFIAGDLQFRDLDDNYFDCSRTTNGVAVPNHIHGMSSLRSSAKFILIIEKDATFQHLLDAGFCQKMAPCIIITARGFPDVNTRLLVRRLWDELHIPTLALVDADPHGIEIVCVYKFGSRSLSFETGNLAAPIIRWIGVWPSDIDKLRVPKETLIPLKQSDINKAKELLKRPYIVARPTWTHELKVMLEKGHKAELQCLQSISPKYLSEIYLPNKLRFGGWI